MSYLITLPMVSGQHTASSLLPPSSRDQTQASHLLSGTPGGLVNPAGFQVVAKHSSSFCVRLVVPGPCLVYRHHDTQQIFIYSTTSSPELPSSKVDEEFCIQRCRERERGPSDMAWLLGPLLITSYSENYLANLLLLAIISFMRRLSGGANTPYNSSPPSPPDSLINNHWKTQVSSLLAPAGPL